MKAFNRQKLSTANLKRDPDLLPMLDGPCMALTKVGEGTAHKHVCHFSALVAGHAPRVKRERPSLCAQERRTLEHVVLADYNTAVGFLLAAAPDQSSRFYRNALNTYALAVRQHSLNDDVSYRTSQAKLL